MLIFYTIKRFIPNNKEVYSQQNKEVYSQQNKEFYSQQLRSLLVEIIKINIRKNKGLFFREKINDIERRYFIFDARTRKRK